VAEFLSPEWFAGVEQRLLDTGPLRGAPADPLHVVLEIEGAPSSGPHAITLSASTSGTSLQPGDHLAAETILTLRYDDALALSEGRLSSATALREGRIKVRGDLNRLLGMAEGLAAVFGGPTTEEPSTP
jgi:hypothetical protein